MKSYMTQKMKIEIFDHEGIETEMVNASSDSYENWEKQQVNAAIIRKNLRDVQQIITFKF